MSEPQRLGNLQHAILRVLWDEGEASVSSITAALREERDLALTTIATMLTKMEKRGLVSHKSEGRQFIYKARVSERSVQRSMVSDLTARLFGGDVTLLVSHLLEEQEIDERELDRLKALIAERGRIVERGSPAANAKSAKEKRRGR